MRQVLKADIDIGVICRSREKLEHGLYSHGRKIGKSVKLRQQAEASAGSIMTLKSLYLEDNY